jgi:hypothetical protein
MYRIARGYASGHQGRCLVHGQSHDGATGRGVMIKSNYHTNAYLAWPKRDVDFFSIVNKLNAVFENAI